VNSLPFELVFWHWWILAVILLALEAFAPGAIFVSMSIAASLVGLLVWVAPAIGWEIQVFTFAVLALITIVTFRAYQRRHPTATTAPLLNRRGQQYVGRAFTLEEPIVNGAGKIRVDDTTWKVHGPDCPAGTLVEVIGVEGVMLKVGPRASAG
jgi:membrane protein implicated in regulation of membrane protease activity